MPGYAPPPIPDMIPEGTYDALRENLSFKLSQKEYEPGRRSMNLTVRWRLIEEGEFENEAIYKTINMQPKTMWRVKRDLEELTGQSYEDLLTDKDEEGNPAFSEDFCDIYAGGVDKIVVVHQADNRDPTGKTIQATVAQVLRNGEQAEGLRL